MSMAETTDEDSSEREQRISRAALRMRRYRRRRREAQRNARRNARRLVFRMETGEKPIRSYADLVDYLIARRKALGLTVIELDARCGFYDGYVSHLENWRAKHGRVAGAVAMELWFQALGVELRPVAVAPDVTRKPRLNGADLARRPRE